MQGCCIDDWLQLDTLGMGTSILDVSDLKVTYDITSQLAQVFPRPLDI